MAERTKTASISDASDKRSDGEGGTVASKLAWFVGLWLLGVGAVSAVAFLIKLVI